MNIYSQSVSRSVCESVCLRGSWDNFLRPTQLDGEIIAEWDAASLFTAHWTEGLGMLRSISYLQVAAVYFNWLQGVGTGRRSSWLNNNSHTGRASRLSNACLSYSVKGWPSCHTLNSPTRTWPNYWTENISRNEFVYLVKRRIIL